MRILINILKGVLPLALLGIAALAAVTMIRNRPVAEVQPPPIEPPGVRVHVVELADVDMSVVSEGTVRPRTESELVPEISGRVLSISPSFAEGGFFEEGDTLLEIDPFDYEQAVIAARSQLAQSRLRLAQEEAEAEIAEREWNEIGEGNPRALTLREPQLEDARAAVAAAEASLVRAERDLDRAHIRAPYAGRVRRKNVDVGQFVTMGSSVATIYSVDVAEIRLPLPDVELAYLNLPLSYRGGESRLGPEVTVRTTFAGATHAWEGRIVRTESEIDPVSRMVHVVAEVMDPYRPGPDPNRPPLAVGMYVDAEIEGRRFGQIAVIPRSALRGRDQVMVVDDDSRMRFRTIEILRLTTTSIYTPQGLRDGERVAITTVDSPTEGMLVQVTNDEEAAALAAAERSAAPAGESASEDAPASEAETAPVAGEGAAENRIDAPPAGAPEAPAAARPVQTPAESATETAGREARAVAVLPFADLSRGATDSGFGTALGRQVMERLQTLDNVAIVPTVTQAGWVVGGAVQQSGDDVRVTVRVVETGAGEIAFTIQQDGGASGLAALRANVATAVSNGLSERLAR